MIQIDDSAQRYFGQLIAQQGEGILGVLLRVEGAGTPSAECKLEFCERSDLAGTEWIVECEGFSLYVDADAVAHLEGASIAFERQATGGQLTIRAPNLKGRVPGADASLVDRIRYVLDSEINPGLAAHGGRVQLEAVEADGTAVLRFGGGCHGCGMVDVTLRDGIERTLRERVPEITGVRDATDHSTGRTPYMRRQAR